jgi:hypothetical protein
MNIGINKANLDPDLLQFSVNDDGEGLDVNEGDADVDNDDDDDCDVDGSNVEAFVDLAKMAHKYCSTQCH